MNKNNKNKKSFFSSVREKLKWFDPFTYVDLYIMPLVKQRTDSKLVETIVNVFFAGVFALLFYLLFALILQNPTPLVIVYSASMQPELYRGDVIFISGLNETQYLGPEIIINQNLKNEIAVDFITSVYDEDGLSKMTLKNNVELVPKKDASIIIYPAFNPNTSMHNQPIIHRSIAKLIANDGNYILTKGDNDKTNFTFDQDCGKIDTLRNASEIPCITFYPINTNQIQGVAVGKIPLIGCVKLWLVDDLFSLISTGNLPKDFSGIC